MPQPKHEAPDPPGVPEQRTPLRTVAGSVGAWVGMAGTIITALIGWGVVTATQGDALTGLLGAIPAVITGVTGVLAAFHTARQGEPLVTPISSPRSALGERLVPEGDVDMIRPYPAP